MDFSQDSALWWIFTIVGIVIEVLTSLISDPAGYGIPAGVLPIFRIVVLVGTVFSAKMSASWAARKVWTEEERAANVEK